jgi:hypothetical protein
MRSFMLNAEITILRYSFTSRLAGVNLNTSINT